MKRTWIIGIGLLWLVIIATLPTTSKLSHIESNSSFSSDVKVLDFSIQLINETELYMEELLGEIILIDLMATYCLNCMIQIDILNSIFKTYRNITIVTISVTLADSIENLSQYALDYKISWLIGLDKYQQAIDIFNVTIIPTIVLIGSQGMVHYYNKGVTLEPQLEEWITAVDNSSSQSKRNTVYSTSGGTDLISNSTRVQTSPSIPLLLTVAFLCLIILLRRKER
ncbi:MAG: TlpA family protein disulfide reductase [Candidatus Hodarchaeales archaeon]|jgi:thiol-disulfide isomerase/thioredoxin